MTSLNYRLYFYYPKILLHHSNKERWTGTKMGRRNLPPIPDLLIAVMFNDNQLQPMRQLVLRCLHR